MKTKDKTRFDHASFEKKWQKMWLDENLYTPDVVNAKKPFYNLMMFPYPSAEGLHVGNMYAFAGADIYGRFKRMQGYDVLEPIGLDGFGIHSENYAIKVGRHPKENAQITESKFYNQLAKIGNSYAWDMRLETYDPDYYKWTQWLFVKLFKQGLAYKGNAKVNWCPKCKTVLADEQVVPQKARDKEDSKSVRDDKSDSETLSDLSNDVMSVCERCDTEVERREMSSWYFKITEYADRLLENIDSYEREKVNTDPNDSPEKGLKWPEKIKIAQRKWIGKKEGINISYLVKGTKRYVNCWTSRPDTNFGATFVVVSPEYAQENLLTALSAENKIKVTKYINTSLSKSEQQRLLEGREKTGIFTGLYAINALNNYEMPIWVADFVLSGVGTGAVVGVPAHDKRDFEFAKEFDLEIIPVVVKADVIKKATIAQKETIREIFETANKNNKLIILKGGWGIESFSPIIIRNHEDIDFHFNEKDKKYWQKWFKDNGYEEESKETVIKFIRQDLIVELEAISQIGNKIIWHNGNSSDKDDVYETVDWMGVKINRFVRDLEIYLKRKKKLREKDITDLLILGDRNVIDDASLVQENEGVMINSGFLNGLNIHVATKKMMDHLEEKGMGVREYNYHLRDWLISRQRYWGPPIPMIFCAKCSNKGIGERTELPGWYSVPESELPVVLPDIKDFKPKGDGTSPLFNAPLSWKETKCPRCGAKAERELDVSDTFLDSSWYFLRYPSVNSTDNTVPWDKEITDKWLPVDRYIGGAEHAVLHLLYARFITMALKDMDLLNFEEPFPNLFGHGLIIKDGAKMSKSKGNVINPDDYIAKYGADALRCYLMFLGPYDAGGDFRDTGMEGMQRFLQRVWDLFQNHKNLRFDENDNVAILAMTNKTTKKVTEDLAKFKYNTALSAIMEFVNFLRDMTNREKADNTDFSQKEWIGALNTLTKLIAPYAPFMSEELWVNNLGEKHSIHTSPWPQFDDKYLTRDTVEIVLQVNGKLRDTMLLDINEANNEDEVVKLAYKSKKIMLYLKGKGVRKVIFVPGRLVNFVV